MSEQLKGTEGLVAVQRVAARLLAHRMSQISEDFYAAQWHVDLEYELWAQLTGALPPRSKEFQEELDELRWLSNECVGWVFRDDSPESADDWGERYVPIETWKE